MFNWFFFFIDSDNYGSDKYYHQNAFDSPPSSLSQFGLPSSPSPSFGLPSPPSHSFGLSSSPSPSFGLPSSPSPFYSIARRSSSTAQPCAQPSADHSSLRRRPPSWQQRPSNIVRYQMSHSKGFRKPPAVDKESFRSWPDSDGDSDSDHENIVNYNKSDDSDFETADGDALRLQPSTKSSGLLTPLSSTSNTPTLQQPPVMATSTRAPFVRPTRRPSPSIVIDLSPTPTMTAIKPIIIEVWVGTCTYHTCHCLGNISLNHYYKMASANCSEIYQIAIISLISYYKTIKSLHFA